MFAMSIIASPARAQDAVADARALFAEGVQLSADGHFADAEARFREALTLHDAPAIRYNLASVLSQQEEYPEARSVVDSVMSDPTTPANILELATTLAAEIDQRAGYLTVTLRGRATVAVDSWTLSDPSAEVPVAPGAHTVTATRDAEVVASAHATVQTGEHASVELDAEPTLAAEPEVPAAALAPAAEAPVTEQWWFWTGIVVAIVGAAAVITAIALTTSSDAPAAYQGNYEPGILRF